MYEVNDLPTEHTNSGRHKCVNKELINIHDMTVKIFADSIMADMRQSDNLFYSIAFY